MATYLLFCTADIAPEVLDTLLSTPKHDSFSLVRNPEQSAFDLQPTKTPVAPFNTGFANWTSEQIRKFVTKHLPDTPNGSNLVPGVYALLDARGGRDGTIVIGHSYSPLLERDVDTMTEEEREEWEEAVESHDYDNDEDLEWWEWRVTFDDSWHLTTLLDFESDSTRLLYDRDFVASHTDANGVFQMTRAWKEFTRGEGD
ncbi:hypothetical protein BDY17DRAFT_92918 [Neohortaea acidophila]|uniref:Uncharacterized protein n=1 Tax=Neohortaea acidophila TaxID=245834 RepID=A0A6A6PXI1_9PEZI|nr:uncharacterized protein BDY17DRAFT_92918 [Neohortaea acidophila]KAF2484878.1 hypothetical protein BDY17DRAFT_92918 [Neohortaea acidophila]